MKKLALAYLAGVLSVVAYAYHCGPETIVQVGLRLDAMQTEYVFTAEPRRVLDESGVAEVLAVAPRPVKRGRK